MITEIQTKEKLNFREGLLIPAGKRIQTLSKKCEDAGMFRINGKYKPLSPKMMVIELNLNTKIRKNIKLLDSIDEDDVDFREEIKETIEQLMLDKEVLIKRELSDVNEQINFANYAKKVFVVLLENEVMLASGLVSENSQQEIIEVMHPNTFTLPDGENELAFLCTKAFQTFLSDMKDHIYGEINLDLNGELKIHTVNVKNGEERYYGVLGYTQK